MTRSPRRRVHCTVFGWPPMTSHTTVQVSSLGYDPSRYNRLRFQTRWNIILLRYYSCWVPTGIEVFQLNGEEDRYEKEWLLWVLIHRVTQKTILIDSLAFTKKYSNLFLLCCMCRIIFIIYNPLRSVLELSPILCIFIQSYSRIWSNKGLCLSYFLYTSVIYFWCCWNSFDEI